MTTVQWVVNATTPWSSGVMIVTGGRLADLFGRREAFVGAGIFLVASLAAAAARPRPG